MSTYPFEEYRKPDGKRAWRLRHESVSVSFHAIGRRGHYWVGWQKDSGRSGGEHALSFYHAEKRALAIFGELVAPEALKSTQASVPCS